MIDGTKGPDKAAEALAEMKKNISKLQEAHNLQAQVDRSYYDALVSQGFTKKEALEVLKATKGKNG